MKYRSGRLGEEIRRIISSLLLRGLKDPRLDGMVSITAVDVTSDCSYASVYITAFGVTEEDTERREEILEAFYSAKGLIRKEIGRQIKLHRVPDLNFKFDTSLEYGRHMEEVITGLNISHDDDNEQEGKDGKEKSNTKRFSETIGGCAAKCAAHPAVSAYKY